MTFKDVAIKNFRSHFSRYLSYFLCSSFSIMIFFMYSTILLNDKLANNSQIADGVLDGLIVPTVALVIFAIVFISYAYSSFIKSRQQEFGLYMSLGMSNSQIVKIIVIENGLIGIASIFSGIIAGGVFSRIFFIIVLKVLQVNGINFSIPFKSFLLTFIAFTVIFSIAILASIYTAYKFQPIQLLKSKKVSQRNKISNPALGLAGIATMVISIIFLYLGFISKTGISNSQLLITTLGCLIGLYIIISQLGGLLIKLSKRNKDVYYKNLRFITGLDYRFKQTKKIIFVTAIMVMITTFYCGAMVLFLASVEKSAEEYNPYDIAFVQLTDKNNIPETELNSILSSGETQLMDYKTLEVMKVSLVYQNIVQRHPRRAISVEELNNLTGSMHTVKEGQYLTLNQIPMKDEEVENNHHKGEIVISSEKLQRAYSYQGSINRIYFNRLKTLWADIIVLNKNDYDALKAATDYTNIENVHLINYRDWRKTASIVDKLNEEFKAYNLTTPKNSFVADFGNTEEEYFRVISRLEYYLSQKQSSSIMLFVTGFLGLFFFISSTIILSFRLFSEIEDERIKYKQLSNIGIRDIEIRKTINQELGIVFFIPVILGTILSFIYIYGFTSDGGIYALEPLYYNLLVSLVYTVFQSLYYLIIRRIYSNKIIESIAI